jgi:polyhydroxybutyrate depolymerase
MRLFLPLILALTLPAAAGARLLHQTLRFGGTTRHYLLHVPASLAAHPGPRPLVLVLHGGGGSAREVRRSTRERFETLADRDGFLVLYPDAIGRIWDTGEGAVSAALRSHRDDFGFLKAAIAATSATWPIDRKRVFATGVSRGGHASYMLACKAPGLIRAIAPVSMTLPEGLKPACARGAPLGILLIEGTADPLVPYTGGRVTVLRRKRDLVLSAAATMALFRARNHCGTRASNSPIGAVDRLSWAGCATPTRLDRVNGGGHGWPGGRQYLPRRFVGAMNHDLSAPDEIWAYFSRF